MWRLSLLVLIFKMKKIIFFGLIFILGLVQFSSGAAIFPELEEQPLFGIQSFENSGCIDSDNDGVCDYEDKCLDSKPRERIDKNGCDPFQFCKKFNCGAFCSKADFLGNEFQKTFPGDCTTVVIAKEGKYYPKCVPLQCEKQLRIPDDIYVNVSIHRGTDGYFNTSLWDVPPGYDVFTGYFIGWCLEETTYIQLNKRYSGKLYSSYDPDLATKCPACVDDDWDLVNYIINNKRGHKFDVQEAIWHLIEDKPMTRPGAVSLVEEARLYGEGFWPQESEWMAIIVYLGKDLQLTIIEVDP
jgi:hypothetical protein